MTESSDFDDQPRRGLISQVATTIFVGIPMTMGLVVALGFYCTFEFAKFALFPKPEPLNLPRPTAEDTFTASLANFAQIHGATPKIETPTSPAAVTEKDPSAVNATK